MRRHLLVWVPKNYHHSKTYVSHPHPPPPLKKYIYIYGYRIKSFSHDRIKSTHLTLERLLIISQIYFWNKTIHVSDSFSVHHHESSTVHTAMVYVIQLASGARDLSANLYDVYHYCVYSGKLLMMDRGTVRNM